MPLLNLANAALGTGLNAVANATRFGMESQGVAPAQFEAQAKEGAVSSRNMGYDISQFSRQLKDLGGSIGEFKDSIINATKGLGVSTQEHVAMMKIATRNLQNTGNAGAVGGRATESTMNTAFYLGMNRSQYMSNIEGMSQAGVVGGGSRANEGTRSSITAFNREFSIASATSGGFGGRADQYASTAAGMTQMYAQRGTSNVSTQDINTQLAATKLAATSTRNQQLETFAPQAQMALAQSGQQAMQQMNPLMMAAYANIQPAYAKKISAEAEQAQSEVTSIETRLGGMSQTDARRKSLEEQLQAKQDRVSSIRERQSLNNDFSLGPLSAQNAVLNDPKAVNNMVTESMRMFMQPGQDMFNKNDPGQLLAKTQTARSLGMNINQVQSILDVEKEAPEAERRRESADKYLSSDQFLRMGNAENGLKVKEGFQGEQIRGRTGADVRWNKGQHKDPATGQMVKDDASAASTEEILSAGAKSAGVDQKTAAQEAYKSGEMKLLQVTDRSGNKTNASKTNEEIEREKQIQYAAEAQAYAALKDKAKANPKDRMAEERVTLFEASHTAMVADKGFEKYGRSLNDLQRTGDTNFGVKFDKDSQQKIKDQMTPALAATSSADISKEAQIAFGRMGGKDQASFTAAFKTQSEAIQKDTSLDENARIEAQRTLVTTSINNGVTGADGRRLTVDPNASQTTSEEKPVVDTVALTTSFVALGGVINNATGLFARMTGAGDTLQGGLGSLNTSIVNLAKNVDLVPGKKGAFGGPLQTPGTTLVGELGPELVVPRAGGGELKGSRQPYMVGQRGPEIIRPDEFSAGTVIPANQTEKIMSGQLEGLTLPANISGYVKTIFGKDNVQGKYNIPGRVSGMEPSSGTGASAATEGDGGPRVGTGDVSIPVLKGGDYFGKVAAYFESGYVKTIFGKDNVQGKYNIPGRVSGMEPSSGTGASAATEGGGGPRVGTGDVSIPVLKGGDYFGKVAAYFESGGDPGRVSTGNGDPGGKSYGAFQLSSKQGSLQRFLNQTGYIKNFQGLDLNNPGPEVDQAWQSLAQTDPQFIAAQGQFAKSAYFDPHQKMLKEAGIDLSGKGRAVQEMILSTANQYGAASSVIINALKGTDYASMSDEQLIKTVEGYKKQTVGTYFSSSSADVQRGVSNRIDRETALLLNVNGDPETKGFANGGQIFKGTPSIVGEKGPEMFLPGATGSVISNADTKSFLSGSSRQGGGAESAASQQPIKLPKLIVEFVSKGQNIGKAELDFNITVDQYVTVDPR